MSRKVFYSFHYERDAWRAAQVRNCNAIADEDEYGVIDGVEWEQIKRGGDEAIKRWIKEQLNYTSITAVLIGTETADRDWVRYEIEESWKRGNGIVGIRIHSVKNNEGETDPAGANPLDEIMFEDGSPLSSVCKTYDWSDDGRENITAWVEEAYQMRTAMRDKKEIGEVRTPTRPSVAVRSAGGGPTIITNPPRPWA